MANTYQWGLRKSEFKEKQRLQILKNEQLRQQFKQKPVSEVRAMLANHGLKLVRGRGIFEV